MLTSNTTYVTQNRIVYDTIKVITYETAYDTVSIYNPTHVAIKFLYESETQQVVGIDTIYMDSPNKVVWDVTGKEACVNIIHFQLVLAL